MDINKELDNLESLLSSAKLTNDELNDAQDKVKKLRSEIDSLNDSDPSKAGFEQRLIASQKKVVAGFASIKTAGQENKNFFSEMFGEISAGLDANASGIGGLTDNLDSLYDTWTDFGVNMAFWREYDRRIREVGVSYGVSANRLDDFRKSNLELEKSFVSLGFGVDAYSDAISALYQTTDRTNQLNQDFVDSIGGIMLAMGVTGNEAGKILGEFANLNVSFETTGKILNDLRNSAEKAGLNTKKVLDQFTSSFEKLNTYSFKNGVQGMMDMVKQSNMLKINMDRILDLSDKFSDPEQTMEFASSMQLLGGAFGQLGDFNQLMYDAAVAPEDLAKNIAKATSSLGTFNRETGQIELSFADAQYMRELTKNFGISREELNKMAVAGKKLEDIKMSVNMRPLTEDQLSVISSVAEFKDGEYVVKMKDESGNDVKKSIAELSDEDITKLTETKETEELKSLKSEKFDAVDMTAINLKVLKYDSPDFFKAAGGFSEEFKNSLMGLEDQVLGISNTLKTKLFIPFENEISNLVSSWSSKELKAIGDIFGEIDTKVKELITFLGSTDLVEEIKKSMRETADANRKGERGGILTINQFAEGNLLEGPPHSEGGIPFTIGGKSGFEAEGGEVLLTKGVSEDPLLLSIASRINEMGGGKKLYEYGDVLTNNTNSIISSNYNSLEKKINEGDNNFESITNLLNTNYGSTDKKVFEDGDIIKNNSQSINSIYNVINKKLESTKDTPLKNENIVNNNYNNISKKVFEDGGVVNTSNNDNSSAVSLTIKNLTDLIQNFQNETLNTNSVDNFQNFNQENVSYENVMTYITEFGDRLKETMQNVYETLSSNILNTNNVDYTNQISPSYFEGTNQMNNTSDTMNQYVKNLNYDNMMSSIATANNNQNTNQYGGDNSTEIRDVSNIVGEIGKVAQGGLIERRDRTDLLNGNINVNGNVKVDGTIAFSNPTIKVSIDGLPDKDMPVPKKVSDEIYSVIEKELSKVTLYSQLVKQKGSGVNDGKSVEIPGILV